MKVTLFMTVFRVFFQISVPLSMDEIPALPEPEGSLLRQQLKQVRTLSRLYLFLVCLVATESGKFGKMSIV